MKMNMENEMATMSRQEFLRNPKQGNPPRDELSTTWGALGGYQGSQFSGAFRRSGLFVEKHMSLNRKNLNPEP